MPLSLSAQLPTEDCTGQPSLGNGDMFPFDQNLFVNGDDFDMSGTGCNEQGFDNVVCFTPTNDCTIMAESYDADTERAAFKVGAGLQFSVSVVEGVCNTAPVSSLDSSQGTGSSGQATVALTGGQPYCVVGEVGNMIALGLNIIGPDCGALALPIELVDFQGLVQDRTVVLQWETASETQNAGFDIEHRLVEVFDVTGRRMGVLHDGVLSAQTAHHFRLTGQTWPTGSSLIRVTGRTFGATQRVMLLK